jgi:four helix bundle protein
VRLRELDAGCCAQTLIFFPMHSYRRLDAWKHAHSALGLTLRATDQAYHPRSRALFDQLKRAVISVEANIVEGYALGSPALCRRHLRIALGSAAEAECLALAAGEAAYLTPEVVTTLGENLGYAMRALRLLLRNPPNSGG